MWKKSLSEKIARVFEIVNYLFIIPAVLLLGLSLIIFLIGLFTLNLVTSLYCLVSILVFGLGITLFVGYVKHSRGNMVESKIIPLWMGTFLYNVLPLMYVCFKFFADYREKIVLGDLGEFTMFLILWWIMACCLSLTAIYDEFIENKI